MELPDRAVSIFALLVYLLLIGAGVWVAVTRDAVTAYIAFAWLNPLAAALLWRFDFEIFWGPDFAFIVLGTSFLAGVVCLPVIVVALGVGLSTGAFALVLVAALLHGAPFLMYALIWLSVRDATRHGRRIRK
jgi:hypothetical protein